MKRYIAWGIVAVLLVLVWLTNPSPELEPPEHIKAILKLAKEVETNPVNQRGQTLILQPEK